MIIQSKKVWYREKFQPLQILLERGKITSVQEYDKCMPDVDYEDSMIIPGLVDIHTHGYDGLDCNHATEEWLSKWVQYLPSEGVTSILATTSSVAEEKILNSMAIIAKAIERYSQGAQILGINTEGPLINPKFRGAQNLEAVMKPTIETVKKYQQAADGKLLYCAIAPEMDDDFATIKYCHSQGIKVAIGHSCATFSQCSEAQTSGADAFVHTFNGMPSLHHRELGPVGTAMYMDDMYAEIIGDGIHVDLKAVNILGRLKGKDHLILVSDAVQIKGLAPGEYYMPGRHVFLDEDGVGRLPNGTIAGGTGKMNKLLCNLIVGAGLPEEIAINAATCNPLKLLGLTNSKGYIEKGYDADITVLDADYLVLQTYVMGKPQL